MKGPWVALTVFVAVLCLGALFVREGFVGGVSEADTAAIEAELVARDSMYQHAINAASGATDPPPTLGTLVNQQGSASAQDPTARAYAESLMRPTQSSHAIQTPLQDALSQGATYVNTRTTAGNRRPVPTAVYADCEGDQTDNQAPTPVAVQVGPADKYPFPTGYEDNKCDTTCC